MPRAFQTVKKCVNYIKYTYTISYIRSMHVGYVQRVHKSNSKTGRRATSQPSSYGCCRCVVVVVVAVVS